MYTIARSKGPGTGTAVTASSQHSSAEPRPRPAAYVISVTPDAIERTRRNIARAERSLLLERARSG